MVLKNKPISVRELQGVYTSLITPMRGNGDRIEDKIRWRIDYQKLRMLVDDQIKAGVTGLVPAGTTGQSATVGKMEQITLIENVFRYVNGRVPIIAGAGSNCTHEAIELSQRIEKAIGPTTFLHVTGYYNNPPQEGLYEHFKAVADSVEGNIIMYNVPSRTKSDLEAKTVIELAKHPKIIGIKEASGDLDKVREIINNTNADEFRVVSGEDDIVADIIQMGGYGVICASANIAPKLFAELVEAGLKGNHEEAARLQRYVMPLVKEAVFAVKNPIPLSYMFDSAVRLPLVDLEKIANGRYCKQIDGIIKRYSPEELGIDLGRYNPTWS